MFQCPNCRAFTDLSAEVDDSNDLEEKREKEPAATQQQQEEPQNGPTEQIQPDASSESQNIPSTNDVDQPEDQLGDVTEEEGLPNDTEEASLSNGAQEASLSNGAEGMLIHHDQLGSLIEEDSLASGLEHLLIQDYLRADTRSDDAQSTGSPAPESSNTDLARSATISIPGWQPSQPLSIPPGRQAQLRSDTPGRSETSDDNPLTPRNDSGPLAFDGRAGMP
jgi:hypothetical protein